MRAFSCVFSILLLTNTVSVATVSSAQEPAPTIKVRGVTCRLALAGVDAKDFNRTILESYPEEPPVAIRRILAYIGARPGLSIAEKVEIWDEATRFYNVLSPGGLIVFFHMPTVEGHEIIWGPQGDILVFHTNGSILKGKATIRHYPIKGIPFSIHNLDLAVLHPPAP